MFSVQVENLTESMPEMMPLLPLHYEELALDKDNYGHKRARNKRIGPGGGTRQLHQTIGG